MDSASTVLNGHVLLSPEVDPGLVETCTLGANCSKRGSPMPKSHPPYSAEFRAEALRLVRTSTSGKSKTAIAQDLGISRAGAAPLAASGRTGCGRAP